jgi:hypothetical protein
MAFAATASKRGAFADMNKAATDVAQALPRLSELTIFELRGEWRRLRRWLPSSKTYEKSYFRCKLFCRFSRQSTTSDYDRGKLQERLAKLGVTLIRVGGATNKERSSGRRAQRHPCGGGRRVISRATPSTTRPEPSVRCVAAMRPESGVLACVLLIELFTRFEDLAYMSARPRTERFDGLPQGAAELGQFVIHALRSGGEDSPRHQAVSL